MQPGAVGAAYLQRVQAVRLDINPDEFMRLRSAYELLSRGGTAPPGDVTAARAELAARPDAVDARWRLLSYFPYGTRPEAAPILGEGAERQPDAFLDELLFHFPEKVTGGVLRGAQHGAGFGRLLLIADVHAVQGRPAAALEVFRIAMSAADLHSPATLKLAARPVMSLHEHAQIDAAREALSLLKQRAGQAALDEARNLDWKMATIFKIADELGNLGLSLPFDLRQVAARAAKRGDFDNVPYEARAATGHLKPREVRRLSAQLKIEAPTLAKTFALDVPLKGTLDFRHPLSWVTIVVILLVVVRLALFVYRMTRDPMADTMKMLDSVTKEMVNGRVEEIRRACTDPDSERCRYYRTLFSNQARNEGGATGANPTRPDGGLELDEIGSIGAQSGTPGKSPTHPHQPRSAHAFP
ncbi:MAG TPA: hypothetical protein VFH68_14010 [Polyangia bacterium]|jgi:hypothetical protein|nr:hypothetical protein [Polyangia bacterium]